MENTHISPSAILHKLRPHATIYFIGIGGISMSGLAYLAHARGYAIRGCDRDLASPRISRLRLDGIAVEAEADASTHGADLVVYSLAVAPTSPAILSAQAHGQMLVSRADFLAAVTDGYKTRIAVAGVHGKSTVVGMLSAILIAAGTDPTVLSGAPLTAGADPFRIGAGEVCLVEACEYRDSFLALRPTLGVVTNIELDHPDFFPSMTAVEASFSRFLWQCDSAVVGGDCPALHALADENAVRFGFGAHCALRASDNPHAMTLFYHDEPIGALSLSVTGSYNRANALAATAAALKLGIPLSVIAPALKKFRGVGRRMEYCGTLSTIDDGLASVYLDYAHHPTELTAVITAARERGGRVLAVFQPHTYTRTRALWDDFIAALRLANFTVLTDIYAAREAAPGGTTSSILAREAGVLYADSFACAAQHLRTAARDTDTILILGAGDIDLLLPHLLPHTCK